MSTKSVIEADNQFIADQLLRHLGDLSYRKIASATGHNPETIRRYISDNSKISASFVRQTSLAFQIDANLLLLGHPAPAEKRDLRFVSTESLLLELANRFGRIEETVIGMSLHDELYSQTSVPQSSPKSSDLKYDSLADHERDEPVCSSTKPVVTIATPLTDISKNEHQKGSNTSAPSY